MTPKQKAESLVREYSDITLNVEADDYVNQYTAKECALIAVDEILDECTYWAGGNYVNWENARFKFWQEVKHEIKKVWKK